MESYKSVLERHNCPHQKDSEVHKDKLAETKKREKEIKEALKIQREAEKEKKEQERHDVGAAFKFDRAFYHNSKRAVKEEKEAERRERKKEQGSVCEHGIWKCRICDPVDHHK